VGGAAAAVHHDHGQKWVEFMIMGCNWRYLPQTVHDHESDAALPVEGVAAGMGVNE
jgi:hypothetical protein